MIKRGAALAAPRFFCRRVVRMKCLILLILSEIFAGFLQRASQTDLYGTEQGFAFLNGEIFQNINFMPRRLVEESRVV